MVRSSAAHSLECLWCVSPLLHSALHREQIELLFIALPRIPECEVALHCKKRLPLSAKWILYVKVKDNIHEPP